ncbi:hypothetical protein M8756_00555 [Lutimaribacter sp. EGI FJ00015]|nr:hypothetical protein [Lutimaribacter sp. EGI FJ00015]MCO0635096.1 hypothetical protein [Lutimaribacter sp. EGI FJ00014]
MPAKIAPTAFSRLQIAGQTVLNDARLAARNSGTGRPNAAPSPLDPVYLPDSPLAWLRRARG